MDALRIGRSIRALRLRRRWRQADLAARSGLSRSQVARIERGELSSIRLGDLEATVTALDAVLDLRIRWHGEGLDRLLDAAHAALVDGMIDVLRGAAWQCAVEVSFSIYGERGSIDLLAFHAETRTVLVIEVKSVVPDAQNMLSTLDRKCRLARQIAAERGWDARNVGRLLVVGESSTARRRVATVGTMFATAFPDRGVEVRRWLRSPSGPLAGLLFLPVDQGEATRRRPTGEQRANPAPRPPSRLDAR